MFECSILTEKLESVLVSEGHRSYFSHSFSESHISSMRALDALVSRHLQYVRYFNPRTLTVKGILQKSPHSYI